MIKTDVLVVGAGTAGSALGFLLKTAGKDTLLLEMQDARTKSKLCAGGLETRAQKAFPSVFGETVDEAGLAPIRLEAVYVRCEDYELRKTLSRRPPTGQATPPPEPKGFGSYLRDVLRSGGKMMERLVLRHALGLQPDESFTIQVLPRKRLDDYILGRYLSAGGKLLDHATVRSVDEENGIAHCANLATKETFEVQFQTLVGADGAASIVRRLLDGRRQRAALTLETDVPLIAKEAVIKFTKTARGYCWYIPRGEDATVGCGYHGLGLDAGDICRGRLAAFCAELGLAMPSKLRGALIPVGDDVLLRAGKNAFLIGDAAGLIDVLTGGGIHYALLSAKALADALTGGEDYEKAMRPHVNFVKKNADNTGLFYTATCNFVARLGTSMKDRE
ncbi:MAG: FAD-dependent monooxygenase [Schwartzia sp.]|nr:FAD-dependent monooxygenase [Schwartzia sp. (in: firmicutes)]